MTALLIFIAIVLLIAVAVVREGSRIQAHNDELRRKEYQRRNDLKGGEK